MITLEFYRSQHLDCDMLTPVNVLSSQGRKSGSMKMSEIIDFFYESVSIIKSHETFSSNERGKCKNDLNKIF